MADLTQYYDALKKADAAGNTEDAKRLADYIRANREPKEEKKAPQKDLQGIPDPFSGLMMGSGTEADVTKGALSGVGQLFTGIGELLPGAAGRESAKATKQLQEVGSPEMQTGAQVAMGFAPVGGAATLGKTALQKILSGGLGGSLYGAITPTGIEDTSERLAEKGKSAALTGALGLGLGSLSPLASGTKSLYKLLTGAKTQQEVANVAKEALRAADAGERTLTKEERSLLEQQVADAEKKAQIEKSSAKTERQKQSALSVMPGVKTEEEAGKFRPIPQTVTDVGNYIRDQAENFVNSIKKQRNAAADKNFSAARESAAAREAKADNASFYQPSGVSGLAKPQVFTDTGPIIADINGRIQKGGSSDYLNSLRNLKADLERTKAFEGLEIIRRRLGDAAFGAPEEGFKAIGQQLSGDMYKMLSDQMKKFEPNFEKYLADYKRLSEPIEVFGTKVGKKLTETQDSAGKYYANTAEQIAKDVFSSPEKFSMFVDAVGGNKQIAEAAARRYFTGLLETAKTPKEVEKILRDNRELFKSIPNVKKEIEEKYLGQLVQAETRQAAAKTELAGLTDADKIVADKLKNVEGAKKLFSDAVSSITTAKPGKAIETFDTQLKNIREAEQRAGVQLISDQQVAILREQMKAVENIADLTQRARVIAGLMASFLGISTVGKGVTTALGY